MALAAGDLELEAKVVRSQEIFDVAELTGLQRQGQYRCHLVRVQPRHDFQPPVGPPKPKLVETAATGREPDTRPVVDGASIFPCGAPSLALELIRAAQVSLLPDQVAARDLISARRTEYFIKRQAREGRPAGWTDLPYPPAEMAARIVARNWYYGEGSWRSVQTLASKYKKTQLF